MYIYKKTFCMEKSYFYYGKNVRLIGQITFEKRGFWFFLLFDWKRFDYENHRPEGKKKKREEILIGRLSASISETGVRKWGRTALTPVLNVDLFSILEAFIYSLLLPRSSSWSSNLKRFLRATRRQNNRCACSVLLVLWFTRTKW